MFCSYSLYLALLYLCYSILIENNRYTLHFTRKETKTIVISYSMKRNTFIQYKFKSTVALSAVVVVLNLRERKPNAVRTILNTSQY